MLRTVTQYCGCEEDLCNADSENQKYFDILQNLLSLN